MLFLFTLSTIFISLQLLVPPSAYFVACLCFCDKFIIVVMLFKQPVLVSLCEEETERIAIPTRSVNFGGVADSGLAHCGAICLATRFTLAHQEKLLDSINLV